MALIPGTQLRSHVGIGQVDDFLDEHGGSVHAALNTRSDSQRAQLPPKRATDTITSEFAQIIQRYENAALDKASGKHSSLQSVHSWDEVMQAAKLAQEKYFADAKGGKNSIRRFFRWTGDHSAVLVEWTGVLPNDKYFATLCGGLTVILKAAARRRERREQILEAFDDIPDIILKTQKYHELFPNDLVLRDRALILYLDLLNMIEAMIASLVETSTWKHIKEGLRGSHSDRSLDEKIKESKKSVQALQTQLEYLQTSTLVATNDKVSRMDPRLANIEETMKGAQRMAWETGNRTSAVQSSIGDVGRNIGLMQQDVSKQLEETIRVNRQLESSVEATKNIMAVLKGVLHFAEWKSDQIVSQVKVLIEQQRPPAMLQWNNSRETLLNLMAVDEDVAIRDLTFIQRQSQSIEEREQRQAMWLFSAPRFETWLCSGRSDVVLVEGNSQRYGMARYSSMSLISAALTHELGGNQTSQAVSFFCGLHNLPKDDLAGPCGLMRSFVAQILGIADLGYDVHLSSNHLDALARHDIGDLCSLFHQILSSNRLGGVLFCIIDGISLFEVDLWREEAQLIVSRLAHVAADPRLGTVVKLILTSPGTSRYVKDHIEAANRIWVPRDALLNSRIEVLGRQASASFSSGSSSPGANRDARRRIADEDARDDIYEYGCE